VQFQDLKTDLNPSCSSQHEEYELAGLGMPSGFEADSVAEHFHDVKW
jgi:hypothetical protein